MDKNEILITFVVPVYRVSDDVLRQCVDSILSQQNEKYEVILIDDESPDNAGKVCDELALKNQKIHVIHQKNQGVSVARNVGIKLARGKWIAFVDADDWIESSFIDEFMNITQKHDDADIVISSCYVNYSHAQVLNPFFKDDEIIAVGPEKDRIILGFLCPNINSDNVGTADVGSPWAKLYRREFILENDLRFNPELKRMQDNVFNLFAVEEAKKVVYENRPLYHYRKSTSSGFSRYMPNIVDCYEKVFMITTDFIGKHHKPKEFMEALNVKIIKSVYVYCKMNFFHKDNDISLKARLKDLRKCLAKDIYTDAINNINTKWLCSNERIWYVMLKYKLYLGVFCVYKLKDILYNLTGKGIK